MGFRPCIDIHNGQVKQIVGSSLRDDGEVKENFISAKDSAYYAKLYKEYGLKGGHVIMLNSKGSPCRAATEEAAKMALKAYEGGLQVGGGIDDNNAMSYVNSGASHVIVTSYVFDGDILCKPKMEKLVGVVGKSRVVIDLSCIKKGDKYMIATNRWQTVTDIELNADLMEELSIYCDEYLIHAVDVEGKSGGIDEELVTMLGDCDILPITYAGGIRSVDDIDKLKRLGQGRVNYTIGSALDIFGGALPFVDIAKIN